MRILLLLSHDDTTFCTQQDHISGRMRLLPTPIQDISIGYLSASYPSIFRSITALHKFNFNLTTAELNYFCPASFTKSILLFLGAVAGVESQDMKWGLWISYGVGVNAGASNWLVDDDRQWCS